MAATLIGQNGPNVRHHVEVECKNESGIVQIPFQTKVEETAVVWVLTLKQKHVIHSLVQVFTSHKHVRGCEASKYEASGFRARTFHL